MNKRDLTCYLKHRDLNNIDCGNIPVLKQIVIVRLDVYVHINFKYNGLYLMFCVSYFHPKKVLLLLDSFFCIIFCCCQSVCVI